MKGTTDFPRFPAGSWWLGDSCQRHQETMTKVLHHPAGWIECQAGLLQTPLRAISDTYVLDSTNHTM